MVTQKHSILHVWRASEYGCVQISPSNFLYHNRHLTGYFEFLHGSRMICLPLKISEKLHWQHLFKMLDEGETNRPHLWQYDAISTNPEKQHLPIKQMGTTTFFSFGYHCCTWPQSGPFCRQNPYSGCNSVIDLLVVLEYFFFSFVPTLNKSLRFTRCFLQGG